MSYDEDFPQFTLFALLSYPSRLHVAGVNLSMAIGAE